MSLSNIKTLKQLWSNPEWKKRAKEFTNGKPCSSCNAVEGDTYTDKNDIERKLSFAPHHIEKHRWGLKLYNQVKNKAFSIYWKKITNNPLFEYPHDLSKKEHRTITKLLWSKENKIIIDTLFKEAKLEILQQYIDLDENKITVHCNRCHYAREKGFIICKECGKNYHKPKYERCWLCNVVLKDEQNGTN